MKNNFIIAWPPLSWKSTFAKSLAKELRGSHIPTDPLVYAISEYFPSSSIWHWGISSIEIWRNASLEFTNFLELYLDWYNNQDSCNSIILEWFHVNFEEILRRYNSKFNLLVMGYPDISIEEKMKHTRRVDIKNWTTEKDDKYIYDSIWFFIELSKYFRERCLYLGIPFINTSENFTEVIKSSVIKIIKPNN